MIATSSEELHVRERARVPRLVAQAMRLPTYAAVFAAAFVAARYLHTGEALAVLFRPLVVLVAGVTVLQLLIGGLTRNARLGALAATLAFGALVEPAIMWLALLAATLPLMATLVRSRRVPPLDWPRLTAFLNFIAIVALAIQIPQFGQRLPMSRDSRTISEGIPAQSPATRPPDIFLILLDGYPRADTLLEDFRFDNEPFLEAMRGQGFDVATAAHANYNMTLLSLTSLLNMRHINDLIPNPPAPPSDGSALVAAMNDSQGAHILRELGYEILTIPSGISSMALYGADRVLDTGQVNSFELSVMKAGAIPDILPDLQSAWAHQQQRERLHATFNLLGDVAAQKSVQPRFVFAHVMSPHPPIVFEADGSPRDGWGCFPQSCDLWSDRYDEDIQDAVRGQVAYLNSLVLGATERLISNSARPPVIVIFSDHGRRHDLDNFGEMLRSLFMTHTPAWPGLFPSDSTPIDTLPRILNAYAGTDLPFATGESFVVDLRAIPISGYFPLRPWLPE